MYEEEEIHVWLHYIHVHVPRPHDSIAQLTHVSNCYAALLSPKYHVMLNDRKWAWLVIKVFSVVSRIQCIITSC